MTNPLVDLQAEEAARFFFLAYPGAFDSRVSFTDTGVPTKYDGPIQTVEIGLKRVFNVLGLPFFFAVLHVAQVVSNSGVPKGSEGGLNTLKGLVGHPVGRAAIQRDASIMLSQTRHGEPAMVGAANDLLLQSLVSLWGVFETFASDVLRIALNSDLAAAKRLLGSDDSRLKKVFAATEKKWKLSDLADYGFDVSGHIGDLLLGEMGLMGLEGVQSALAAAFPAGKDLAIALDSKDLRRLNLLRNLVAHRGGVIDARFRGQMEQTGVSVAQQIGETVQVDPIVILEGATAVEECIRQVVAQLKV